jgi:hypothetical protein
MQHSDTKPRVSVVMAVNNGARFLDEAIDSIRRQTYSSFEFIIVNDGSVDETQEILSKHAADDHRLRLISQQQSGLIASLHRCFSEAEGEFIARMDADDVAKPDRLERQVRFLDEHTSVVLVGSSVEIIDAKSRVLRKVTLPTDPETIKVQMREQGCVVFHPTVVVRRHVLNQMGGFRKAYQYAEDYDLWLRMIEKFDLANIGDALLGYRRHERSVSYKNSRQQSLSSLCARTVARLRLNGHEDATSQLSLITESVLEELGVSRSLINEAIFGHMFLVTEEVIQSGVCLAAAEFPRMAREYASAARLRSAALKLNRLALTVPSTSVERQKHRLALLGSAPDVYWELFSPCLES